MKVWDVIRQIEELAEKVVDPETGEVDPDVWFEIERLEMAADEKVENLALYVKNQKAYVDAMKAEVKALNARIAAENKKIEKTTDYLSDIVLLLDGKKFKTAKVNISFRPSQSVEVDDVFKLPEEYLRYKDPEPDKTALKKALKDGTPIPGAHLVNKMNIQIK